MRWQLYGSDALTGLPVELAVDEFEATSALKMAHDRQIVVDKIVRARTGWRWLLGPAGWVLFVAAGVACAFLYVRSEQEHRHVQQAIREQTRLVKALAAAEQLAAQIRQSPDLAAQAASQIAQLGEELSTARTRMSLSEQQLSAAHEQLEDLERAAGSVPGLQTQLASAQARAADAESRARTHEELNKRLTGELVLRQRRLDQLQAALDTPHPAVAQAAALDLANRELEAQVDRLKAELLVAAAQSTAIPVIAPEPDPPAAALPAIPMRWALRVPFDAANDFLVLHSQRDTLGAEFSGDTVTSFGTQPDQALRLRIVHDRVKERVYSATLTVSLAADGPPERIAENLRTIEEFLRTLAAGLKDPQSIASAVTGQLAAHDSTRRLVFMGDDCKVTAWNDRGGMYTFRVESAQSETQ